MRKKHPSARAHARTHARTHTRTHRVSLESLDGFVDAQFAHVDALIRGAGREAVVALPVHVERRRRVEGELLVTVTRTRVPDDRRLCRARNESINESPRPPPPRSVGHAYGSGQSRVRG